MEKDRNEMDILQLIPPRQGGRMVSGVATMLGAVGDGRGSLELAASSGDGVKHLVRTASPGFRQQARAHLPGAEIREVPPDEDPVLISDGEQAWSMMVEVDGEPCQSIATVSEDVGSPDPMRSAIAALDDVHAGERII